MPDGMTSGTTTVVVLSLPILLGLGWLAAVILMVVGRATRRPAVLGWGIVGVGLMVLVSPLTVYGFLASLEGTFPATPVDFVILALLAFLGGAIATVGARRIRSRATTESSGAVR